MTKPKNMTPEQEAAYRAKRHAAYARDAERIKAKSAAWRSDPANREKSAQHEVARRTSERGQVKAEAARGRYLSTDKGKGTVHAASVRGAQKQKERRHFRHFMDRLGAGEDVYGFGE